MGFYFPRVYTPGSALKSQLCRFFTFCMHQSKVPRIWRRALAVVIPKPNKPLGNSKSYRRISLLCVPFKVLKKLLYTCVEPTIELLLPWQQAGSILGTNLKTWAEIAKQIGSGWWDNQMAAQDLPQDLMQPSRG